MICLVITGKWKKKDSLILVVKIKKVKHKDRKVLLNNYPYFCRLSNYLLLENND